MMLEAVNVSKFYGQYQALDGVSFAVSRGETVGFLGGTGSGKSAIMRLLSGFHEPTQGTVRVDGLDPRRTATRFRIGYVPEGGPLPGFMRGDEYLRYRARLKGLAGRAVGRAVDEAAARCGLVESRDRIIQGLTRPARRRLALADCLLTDPDVVLLDEPLAEADVREAESLREILAGLVGVTVAISARRIDEVERICKRAVVLRAGRVAVDDTFEALYERHLAERVINVSLLSPEPVRETLRAVTGVRTVSVEAVPGEPGALTARLTIPAGVDLRHEIAQVCARRGWTVTAMRLEPVKLEDLFRKRTGW